MEDRPESVVEDLDHTSLYRSNMVKVTLHPTRTSRIVIPSAKVKPKKDEKAADGK